MTNSDRLTLLLVEDSPTQAEHMESLMGDYFNVIAISDLSESHRIAECDLILLDLNLKESFGSDTVRKARLAFPHKPIVVLTQITDPVTEASCRAQGVYAYYRKKDFSLDALLRSMEAAVIAARKRTGSAEEIAVHEQLLIRISAQLDLVTSRLEELKGS